MAYGRWPSSTICHAPSAMMTARSLHHSAPADQPDEEEHDGDHQQHIDEVAQRVAAHEPEQPQYDQNDRNCFQHSALQSSIAALPGAEVQLECRTTKAQQGRLKPATTDGESPTGPAEVGHYRW